MVYTEEIMEIALQMAKFNKIPADCAIHVKGRNIERILFGIDAGVSELLLAKQLGYDAVISHHPQGGSAAINSYKVFKRHVEQMVDAGVPLKEAKQAIREKLTALEVEAHTRNYEHAVSVAQLLKMPFMNIHSPLDELGRLRMVKEVKTATEASSNATVGNVVSALRKLSEFRKALTEIKIRLGKASNKAGKVVVSHAALTNGGYSVARTFFKYGVGTVIYIHISLADLEQLKKDGVGNLIVTGHIASDSVGINPFITALEQRGVTVTRVGIIPP